MLRRTRSSDRYNSMTINSIGAEMYCWLRELFPICRSITGKGVRETLAYIKSIIPQLEIQSVPTGYKAFDWEVPNEWAINDAYVMNECGEKVIDFMNNNLHVVSYSEPVDCSMQLEELQAYLHSLPDLPNAIPYITSYYKRSWGFCLSENERRKLGPGTYRVSIDSSLHPGFLNYGELIIPGENEAEIFLSTYICHPSMANNELSGPVVATALARWITGMKGRKYTYRIIFIPETIGSIVYLSKYLDQLKRNVVAGFNLTCMGDDGGFSYMPSRNGDTYADKVALHVLKHCVPSYKRYTFLERGSDERQYCAPGVDLPVVSIMRSKYHEYKEYHTSLDDMKFVSADGLAGSFKVLKQAIEVMESDFFPVATILCEPQMGKRGLYPNTGSTSSGLSVRNLMNIYAYSDGSKSLLDIADVLGKPVWELYGDAESLKKAGLIELYK